MATTDANCAGTQFENKQPWKILKAMKAMRENGEATDVILQCKGQDLKAHSLILMAGSSYLKRLLENKKHVGSFINEFNDSSETTKNEISNEVGLKCIALPDIEEKTMNIILDFMYLSSVEPILNTKIPHLIEIYNAASVLIIEDLCEVLWNLILKQLSIENFLDIWNGVADSKDERLEQKILDFILENKKEIFQTQKYLHFQEILMNKIVEKFHKENIPCEDFLLEGIMQWMKVDPERKHSLQRIIFKLNYESVSKECVDQLLAEEALIKNDDLIKDFLTFQVVPKLKSKNETGKNLVKACVPFKKNQVSMFHFTLGYYLETTTNVNYYKKYVLRLADILNKDSNIKEIYLPFDLRNINQCFIEKTSLYFLTQNAVISDMQYLLCYDGKTNSKTVDTVLPETVIYAGGCTTKDRIYIIGIPIHIQITNSFFKIQYYIVSQNRWCSQCVSEPGNIVACVNMNDNLHILFKSNEPGIYYFIVSSNYSNTPFMSKKFKFSHIFQKELITVYRNDLYCFIPRNDSCLCYVYKPHEDDWYCVTVPQTDWEPMVGCFSVEDQGIYFYSIWGNLFKVGRNQRDIVRVDGHIPIKNKSTLYSVNVNDGNEVFVNSFDSV